ncbi:MAG: glutathione S-transferase N-terminal domain-containing protein [Burkholderiaceae bacterium]|nr:glutathione S-transferase N-terminal domain-containing protein [Burkholderiaceae bacterium]
MKTWIRPFFKTVRLALGPVLLAWERLSRPRALARAPAAQADVNRQCQSLALYQFKTCPFCLKVRQEMHRLALPIAHRDAQHDAQHRAALLQGTGLSKVPCLQITDSAGQVQWLRESGAIISYLRGRFGAA